MELFSRMHTPYPLGKVKNFENCKDSRLFELFENAYEIMFQMLLKVQL